jgi:hypothetical protein
VKARPILFSAEMIRALLDGRKVQTRRALKKQPLDILPMEGDRASREWIILEQREPESKGKVIRCRYGAPGDLLWARETHAIVGNVDPGWVLYRASGYENECRRHKFDSPPPESEITWKPSIHMPRWASRLTLRITNIRVERLQDISEADAIAEGVESLDSCAPENRESCDFDSALCRRCGGLRLYMDGSSGAARFDVDCGECDTHAKRYRWLWEAINGPESWAANPWVWALTFDVIKANVDDVMKREAA